MITKKTEKEMKEGLRLVSELMGILLIVFLMIALVIKLNDVSNKKEEIRELHHKVITIEDELIVCNQSKDKLQETYDKIIKDIRHEYHEEIESMILLCRQEKEVIKVSGETILAICEAEKQKNVMVIKAKVKKELLNIIDNELK